MIKNRKQMFTIIAVFVLILFLGTAYSWFNYRKESGNNSIIAGDLYLTLSEGNETLNLPNIFPESAESARARNDNYITFTISGLNESSKDIYYEILLNHGDEKPSPKSRYRDGELVFDLVELDSNNNELRYVVNAKSFDSLINQRIWVDVVPKNTNSNISRKYKLRAWLSEDVIVSDTVEGATYTTQEYVNKYATVSVTAAGDMTYKEIPSAYNTIKKLADTTTQIDFSQISSSTNGEGVYLLSGTGSVGFPVYYYRGNINNNNVIFGGYCWSIVRTTDTGGVKMIYNGVATDNGTTCTNTNHEDRIIGSEYIYVNQNSVSDAGYMFNKKYYYKGDTPTTGAYFGTSAEYGDFDNNGTSEYRLITTNQELNDTHHYSCDLTTADATCTKLRFYFSSARFIELENGEFIEDALYKMTGTGTTEVKSRAINQNYTLNATDSRIKTIIEDWYKNNLTDEVDNTKTNYTKYIEDTTYCNNRTFKTVEGNTSYPIYQDTGWSPTGSLSEYLYFGTYNRYTNNWYSTTNVPSVTCPNETDQFRVNNPQAPLKYPVGLLTADEMILAGSSQRYVVVHTDHYLYTGGNFWTMSPSTYESYYGTMFATRVGRVERHELNASDGLRPAISLKYGVEFVSGGEGTPTNPYVVKY